MASYSIGNATETSELYWLGENGWVDEFDDAKLFDNELDAQSFLVSEIDNDPRSLSIVRVLLSEFC
jgi:hypothetical protein